jgi:hypothetical protein
MTGGRKDKAGGGGKDGRDNSNALKKTEAPGMENYCLAPADNPKPPRCPPGANSSQNVLAIRKNVRDGWLLQAEIQKVGERITNPEPQVEKAPNGPPAKEDKEAAKPKADGPARALIALGTVGALSLTGLLLLGLAHVFRGEVDDDESREETERWSTAATESAATNQVPAADAQAGKAAVIKDTNGTQPRGLSAVRRSGGGAGRM